MHNSSDDDAEVIREQMEETRNSLTEKLEALEMQVTETAAGAAAAVSDSVQSVKDAVQDTFDTVKGSVQDTVESVKSTFDIQHQVEQHPWAMVAGATVVGFIGGRVFSPAAVQPAAPSQAIPPERIASRPKGGNGAAAQPARPGLMDKVQERYSEEITKLGGLALAIVCGWVRDNLSTAFNPEVGERLSEIIDGATTKMGGQPLRGPVMPARPRVCEPNDAMSSSPATAERMRGRFGTSCQ